MTSTQQEEQLVVSIARPLFMAAAVLLIAPMALLAGCEVDSFFDPSKTGRFEHMATTIPVLDRIDVIESDNDERWGQTSGPLPDDLVPSDLTYRIAPQDVITVDIWELRQTGLSHISTRSVDAAGNYRIPTLGDVQAAGLTVQEFEDEVIRQLAASQIVDPVVDTVVERGGGFRYTVSGNVREVGMYSLNDPGLRLREALATAGGVSPTTERILITRAVPLSDEYKRRFDRDADGASTDPDTGKPPVDIEDLIDQLDDDRAGDGDGVLPGMLRDQDAPPVDIDDLQPPDDTEQGQVDVDDVENAKRSPQATTGFFYDQQRGEWVRIRRGAGRDGPLEFPTGTPSDELVLERIIEIDYKRLNGGDSSLNIVVRPDDLINVVGPEEGLVYISGEVIRPGVFNLPPYGRLTLSRAIATAADLGPLAIPERVDLTRTVGKNREATIRLDLAAIRNRTAPDIILKPDDHIIIGTNFWATPLAIIRNGFRVTYGFGFLLDRNFGNDVFGPPPTNRFGE